MSDADPVGIWPSLDIACFGDAADDRNDQDLRLVQGIIGAAWTNGQNLMPHSLRVPASRMPVTPAVAERVPESVRSEKFNVS